MKHIEKQRHYFANKGPSSQGYGFSSGHVWIRELDCEESCVPKNGCFWTVVLEKTLESPLDCKEIQPVHSKGDQPWVFFERNDAKAETPVLWPPHAKSWLIGKDSDAGRDWRQEEKGTIEDEMTGWHHWLNGREFEWTPGDGDGQGGLACCESWGHKESDTTKWLKWTELNWNSWKALFLVYVKMKVVQSCPTLCDPMDCTVQARILEWVAFLFSRGSSQPRDRTQVSCIASGFFTSWATV